MNKRYLSEDYTILEDDMRTFRVRFRALKFGIKHQDFSHFYKTIRSLSLPFRSGSAATLLLLFDSFSYLFLHLIDMTTCIFMTRCWFVKILLAFWLPQREPATFYWPINIFIKNVKKLMFVLKTIVIEFYNKQYDDAYNSINSIWYHWRAICAAVSFSIFKMCLIIFTFSYNSELIEFWFIESWFFSLNLAFWLPEHSHWRPLDYKPHIHK